MSHQVLARKWRPRSFDALIGQDHVVKALSHALTSGRLHHAYLFSGTRGVGKTTIARILAKAVNCETGMSPSPCGKCSACVQIDGGHFVDYLELDAASNRGVDEMVQLLENAVYAPTAGRYKVYVIDEVHMLSNHAFNAMLKTLEEPPAHVLFILATTDPKKVPVTVLSRCMQFNLRNMRPAAISGHLAHVLQAESVDFDEAAVETIGQVAGGSMRDALSLLDQAIAVGAGSVRQDQVIDMLGLLDDSVVDQVLSALEARDGPALVAIADELAERGDGASRLLIDLAQRFTDLALAQAGIGETRSGPGGAFSAPQIQLYYQIVIHGQRDLPLAPDVRTGLTMAFLRLLAFEMDDESADQGAAPVAGSAPRSAIGQGRPSPASNPPAAADGAAASASSQGASPVAVAPDPSTAASPAPAAQSAAAPVSGAAAARALLLAGRRGPAKPAPRPAVSAPRNESKASPARAMAAALKSGRSVRPASSNDAGSSAEPTEPAGALSAATSAATTARPSVAEQRPVSAPDPSEPPPFGDPDDPGYGAYEANAGPAPGVKKPTQAATPVARSNEHSGVADHAPMASDSGSAVDAPARASASSGTGFDGDWPGLAKKIGLDGMQAQFMAQSQLIACNSLVFEVRVPIQPLADSRLVGRINSILSEYFGAPTQLIANVGTIDGPTALQFANEARAARLADAKASLESDPFVRALLADFDGQIVAESIRSIDQVLNTREDNA